MSSSKGKRTTGRDIVEGVRAGQLDWGGLVGPVVDALSGDAVPGACLSVCSGELTVPPQNGGSLPGVPVLVGDRLDQRGQRTMAGSRLLMRTEGIADGDAAVLDALRRAGVAPVARTTVHELGLGVTGINPHFGTARNPFDARYAAGGAASGAAALVARGLAPLAVSSDTLGDARISAALCGIAAFKPTRGRISGEGMLPLAWTLDEAALLGGCVDDLRLGYSALLSEGGPNPADAERSLLGFRLAYAPLFGMDASAPVTTRFQAVISMLRAQGAVVDPVELDSAQHVLSCAFVTVVAEAATLYRGMLRDHGDELGHDVRLMLEVGTRLSAAEYLHAQRVRGVIAADLQRVLSAYDGLLTPSCGELAPFCDETLAASGELDVEQLHALLRYAVLANLSGLPAVTIPMGLVSDGHASLPVGVQVIGRAWHEEGLLELARRIEHHLGPLEAPGVFDLLAVSGSRSVDRLRQ